MFKRKVKRRRARRESEEEDSDSDDDDDYLSSEEEESDMEDFDDSVCPAGCEAELYQQVFDLRERRLDVEEALVEERRIADLAKKEGDNGERKEKTILASVQAAEEAISQFQTEKQAKLNELHVSVPLQLHQVHHHGT